MTKKGAVPISPHSVYCATFIVCVEMGGGDKSVSNCLLYVINNTGHSKHCIVSH